MSNPSSFFGTGARPRGVDSRPRRDDRQQPNINHRQRTPRSLPTIRETRHRGDSEGRRRDTYGPGVLLQDGPNIVYSSEDEQEMEQYCYSEGEDFHQYDQRYEQQPQGRQELEEATSVKVLLLAQQDLLKSIRDKQDSFETKQAQLEEKIEVLEEQVAKQYPTPSSSENSPNPGTKRKRVVSRELSSLKEQFKPDESSTSPWNAQVRDSIIDELTKNPNCKFAKDTIKVAIKQCYENSRRNYKENQDGMEAYVEEQAKRRRYRARRQRTFDRRSSVVKEAEIERWQMLSYQYMTEESDAADEPNVIILHKLEWRSQTLNKYIHTLDNRSETLSSREGPLNVAKKVRREGVPSLSLPPVNAPSWAVCQVTPNVESPVQSLADVTNTLP